MLIIPNSFVQRCLVLLCLALCLARSGGPAPRRCHRGLDALRRRTQICRHAAFCGRAGKRLSRRQQRVRLDGLRTARREGHARGAEWGRCRGPGPQTVYALRVHKRRNNNRRDERGGRRAHLRVLPALRDNRGRTRLMLLLLLLLLQTRWWQNDTGQTQRRDGGASKRGSRIRRLLLCGCFLRRRAR